MALLEVPARGHAIGLTDEIFATVSDDEVTSVDLIGVSHWCDVFDETEAKRPLAWTCDQVARRPVSKAGSRPRVAIRNHMAVRMRPKRPFGRGMRPVDALPFHFSSEAAPAPDRATMMRMTHDDHNRRP